MDFLHRLAASALGDTGSLRPALPPRFAPRTAAMPAGVLDAGLPPAEGEPPGRLQAEAPAPTASEHAHPSGPAPGTGASTLPAVVTLSVTATSPVTDSQPAEAASASTHPHPAPRETAATLQPPWPLRDAPRVPGPRAASASPVSESFAGPLEAAVVAAQPRGAAAPPATAAAPVVHVVIERIDVRAPAPAPSRPPAAPAPRAQPSASLGEYLRGGKR